MMEKNMKRALRRRHVGRVKKNRRMHWGRDMSQTPAILAKLAFTPTPCSCWACGNPRKYYGNRTIQELRAMQAEHDEE